MGLHYYGAALALDSYMCRRPSCFPNWRSVFLYSVQTLNITDAGDNSSLSKAEGWNMRLTSDKTKEGKEEMEKRKWHRAI